MNGKILAALAGAIIGGGAGFATCLYTVKRIKFKAETKRYGMVEGGFEITACTPPDLSGAIMHNVHDAVFERLSELRADSIKGETMFVEDLTMYLKQRGLFSASEGASGEVEIWMPSTKQVFSISVTVKQTGVDTI